MKIKELFKIKSKRLFINHYILPLLILMAICCLGIGYAAMNVSLQISGTLSADVQRGVFISNVDKGGDTTAEFTYGSTILNGRIVLGEENTSSVEYEVTIHNNNNYDASYVGVICDKNDTDFYSNSNIEYEIIGLSEGDTLTRVGNEIDSVTFTIRFHYKNNTLPENTMNSNYNVLNFVMKFEYKATEIEVTYLGDVANNVNYPEKVNYNENLNIELISNIADVNITTSNNEELDYEVYYDNQSQTYKLLVENITSEINVEIYYYIRVEYIESTGTQYIDTGVLPINIQTSLDFQITDLKNDIQLFGSWYNSNSVYYMSYYNDNIWHGAGRNESNFSYSGDLTERHTIDYYKNNSIYIDGNIVVNNLSNITSSEYSIYLFWRHRSLNPANKPSMKLFSVKLINYLTDETVREFVPCYRTEQGTEIIGLCDIVNNKFYANEGSGQFIRGNEIITEQISEPPNENNISNTNTITNEVQNNNDDNGILNSIENTTIINTTNTINNTVETQKNDSTNTIENSIETEQTENSNTTNTVNEIETQPNENTNTVENSIDTGQNDNSDTTNTEIPSE